MDDATRYRDATERNDIPSLVATLAPDVELVSPLSGRMVFRGRDDVAFLATAVYGSLRELRWTEEIGDGARRTTIGSSRIGPFTLDDAMVFDLDGGGQIRRIRPHLRPWLGATYFALVLGPKVARRPAVVLRALRRR